MNYTSLSLAQTPPLWVPLRYFITAPLFMILSGVVVLAVDPAGFDSRWSPSVLAVTHGWVLGVMAMVMVGALQQLLPVVVGVQLDNPNRLSRWGHGLLTLGTLMLMGAFLSMRPLAFTLATLLLVTGLLFVAVTVLRALFRSTSRHATAMAMKLALTGLLVTTLLGGYLALGHGGWVGLGRHWTDLHLVWGLVGWSGLLLVGVAYQVVPMFQITPAYPKAVMRYLVPGLFLLLLIWSGTRRLATGSPFEIGAALVLTIGLAGFALTTLRLQQQRRRRLPDTTLDFWRLSMGSLLLSLLLVWLYRFGIAVPPMTIGVAIIAGLFGAAINGMLYKIVPFLVWLHLNNRMQEAGLWQGEIPDMKQVIPAVRLRRQFRLYVVMVAVLLLLPFWPALLAIPAALLLIGCGGQLGWQLLGALRLFNDHAVQIAEQARSVEANGDGP